MSRARVLLAVCGLQGAGKDTLAAVLVERHGFAKLSFGTAIKDVCAALFGWDRGLLEGVTPESRAWRETVDEWWAARLGMPGLTPRKALQVVGTDVVRGAFHDDMWVAALERTLRHHPRVVITDCRFPNEVRMVRRHGGKLVHVRRGPLPDWFEPYRAGRIEAPPPGVHVSEYAWAREEFDAAIDNDGDVGALEGWCDRACADASDVAVWRRMGAGRGRGVA